MTEKFLGALLRLGEMLRDENLSSEEEIVERCNEALGEALDSSGFQAVVRRIERERHRLI